MAIRRITRSEFDEHYPARNPMLELLAIEKAWFAGGDGDVIGAVLLDHTDKDWNYVILGPDDVGTFRWIDGKSSFETRGEAEESIEEAMSRIEAEGRATEHLFKDDTVTTSDDETRIVFSDINDELKKYFAKHPDRLYDLSSRKFEELIASILRDFGFDVELTQATHDGGRDIIAYIRNEVCKYLTYVECKKYSATRKVGVDVVREVFGVHYLHRAAKSLIVTTSFFSPEAIKEARMIQHQIELKDYDTLKAWLATYA